jgi:hypothetical protein
MEPDISFPYWQSPVTGKCPGSVLTTPNFHNFFLTMCSINRLSMPFHSSVACPFRFSSKPFYAWFRRVRKIAKSDYWLRHVCLTVYPFVCLPVRPSVRLPSASHWTDFHEIRYLSICRKSAEKIQVSLKSDKTRRPMYIFDNISFSST